jgi:hypothetical protein
MNYIGYAVLSMVALSAGSAAAEEKPFAHQFDCPASGCKLTCQSIVAGSGPFGLSGVDKLTVTFLSSGVAIYDADKGAIGKQMLSVNLNQVACTVESR